MIIEFSFHSSLFCFLFKVYFQLIILFCSIIIIIMKFFSIFLLNICSICSLINCQNVILSAKQPEQPIVPSPFVSASNEFGFNVVEQLNPSPPDDATEEARSQYAEPKNILISPYGLASSLAMLYDGANGQTAEQFAKVMKFDSMDKAMIPKAVKDGYESIQSSSSGVTYRMANALIGKDGIGFTDAYRKMLEDNFQAQLFESNVNMNDLNKMFADKTDNMISQMIMAKPSDISMMLADGTYFSGKWMYPFYEEDSHIDTFFGRNDVTYNNVTFMRKFGRYGFVYLSDVEADMIEFPFKDDQVAFYGILPRDPNDDLSDIRTSLNVSYIEKMINKLSYKIDSTVELPRLNVDYKEEQLSDVLMKMGIVDAFGNDAKFGSISTQSGAHLTQVIHRSKMILNENNAKRKDNENEDSGVAPIFYNFNHPFFYFIRHKQTGQIYMMGEMHTF
ncbi:intracellular coagulation inhibitor 3-like [Dermatophagoides pteronyssinus]|uniref:intracellular coagulation inhibitor 3-like n=1 Tax=Dermatophagoides pteronyssinus TaxID=6956 RepID=UPI003F671524